MEKGEETSEIYCKEMADLRKQVLQQTTAKNEWKLLREETLAELNKMRELNESLSETILQQNEEIVDLKNRLAEKK